MTDSRNCHEFRCDGKTWTVTRRRGLGQNQKGLHFCQGANARFLVFPRGAMPSDAELQGMSEEVFRVLLRRAVIKHEAGERALPT